MHSFRNCILCYLCLTFDLKHFSCFFFWTKLVLVNSLVFTFSTSVLPLMSILHKTLTITTYTAKILMTEVAIFLYPDSFEDLNNVISECKLLIFTGKTCSERSKLRPSVTFRPVGMDE